MLTGLFQQSLHLRRHVILTARRGRHLSSDRLCSEQQTHLTGLYRNGQAAQELTTIYQEILRTLSSFPADYYYRESLEGTINGRLKLLEDNDRVQVERAMGEGLLEEVIEQARAELALIQLAIREDWRPWEPLTGTGTVTDA